MAHTPNPNVEFPRVMCEAAPERASKTRSLLAKHRVNFDAEQAAAGIEFYVNPRTGRVVIGTLGVGRLWAHTFGAWVLYDAVSNAGPSLPERLTLQSTPAVQQAAGLLKWAVSAELALTRDPRAATNHKWITTIPEGLPLPFDERPDASSQHIADDLTMLATAFIMLHELAHLELSHVPCTGSTSLRQEHEADVWAADWMLSDCTIEPLARTKRLLGITMALGWLASSEVYKGVILDDTHPPSHSRLEQVLKSHVQEPNDVIWAFIMVYINAHLNNRGVPPSAGPFDTFKDAALDRIAQIPAIMQ